MSNCNQNCWIDRISAMLCFKRLVHIGVCTFVRPLLATILCIGRWEIRSPRIHVSRISVKTKSAPILKLNDDQKSNTFLGPNACKLLLFCCI